MSSTRRNTTRRERTSGVRPRTASVREHSSEPDTRTFLCWEYDVVKKGARLRGPTPTVTTPLAAVSLVWPWLKGALREKLCAVMLDTHAQLIGWHQVSLGTAAVAPCVPREFWRVPVQVNAVYVVALHNHPSGVSKPSQEDLLLTKRLVEAGKILGIVLQDHIVVGDAEDYASLRQLGYFDYLDRTRLDLENTPVKVEAGDGGLGYLSGAQHHGARNRPGGLRAIP